MKKLLIGLTIITALAGCGKSEVPRAKSKASHVNYVSWVQDGEKGKMGHLVEEMNIDVKRGVIKSPKGSGYIAGSPRSGKSEEAGIYFFDPTRSN